MVRLSEIGIKDIKLDAAILTNPDCDHEDGLKQVKGARIRFNIPK